MHDGAAATWSYTNPTIWRSVITQRHVVIREIRPEIVPKDQKCVSKGSEEHRATSGCLLLKQKIATLSPPICKVLTLNIECYLMCHVLNLCNTCWRHIQTYPSIDSHHECQRSTVRGSLPGWPAENKPSKSKYINLCDILYTKIV